MTPGPLCTNCHARPGTLAWVGEGGALAYVHGLSRLWCEPCIVKAQLDYALDRAAAVPELTRRYLELVRAEARITPVVDAGAPPPRGVV